MFKYVREKYKGAVPSSKKLTVKKNIKRDLILNNINENNSIRK